MADPVTTDPLLLAAIAVLAAKDGRPDALARGDQAAAVMAQQGIWTAAFYEQYKALGDAERLKGWKGEVFVQGLEKPSAETVATLTALYESLYAGLSKTESPGFISDSWPILKGAAVVAALNKDPDALEKGDKAANAMALAGQWLTSDYGLYLKLSPEARVAFWASGGDRASLGGVANKPAPVPGDSSNTMIYVVGGIAGLWFLSKMFGKGR